MIITGCGREPAINADMKSAVDRYLRDAPNQGHYDELTSVDYGSLPDGQLGKCNVITSIGGAVTSRNIRIQRDSQRDPILLDVLVAHELGHCLHDKIHDDMRVPMLMNTKLMPSINYWSDHLDDEIRNLF
jgi:hypothetical protein